ncbi:F-box/LRR-repeat protein fbxl-1 [Anabrus simplex]|uniref:F-box/LRR-repeat protein fbxl-1 n=1 Tax=Anabrus simplex TaxID=316456 RepID=UPI0034DD610F
MAAIQSIDSLPDELMVEIFTYIPMEELVTSVQNVSRRWNSLALDGRLWKDYTFAPPANYGTEQIVKLLSKMPRLKSFSFSEMHDFHPIILALCRHCPEVMKVTCNTPNADLEDIELFSKGLPSLEYLNVHPTTLYHMMSQVRPNSFSKLSRLKCSWSTEYYGMYLAEHTDVVNINFKSLQHLEVMTVYNSSLMEKLIEDNAGSLQQLSVSGVYDKLLSIILKCEKLAELKLNFLSRVCDGFKSSLPQIGKMKNLKTLSLRLFVDSSKDVLCNLFADGNLRGLVELDLSHCMNFSPRVAASIAHCCPELRVLRLQACVNLDDSCMEQLAKCRDLRMLNVSGCARLTEKGLAHIASCRQLHTLDLAWLGGISGLMLESLAGSVGLRKLTLDHNEMSESDLINAVRKMPSLVHLRVYRCPELDPVKLQESLPSVRVNSSKPPRLAAW